MGKPPVSGQLLAWLWPCCSLIQSLEPALSTTGQREHLSEGGGAGNGQEASGMKRWQGKEGNVPLSWAPRMGLSDLPGLGNSPPPKGVRCATYSKEAGTRSLGHAPYLAVLGGWRCGGQDTQGSEEGMGRDAQGARAVGETGAQEGWV